MANVCNFFRDHSEYPPVNYPVAPAKLPSQKEVSFSKHDFSEVMLNFGRLPNEHLG